MHNVQAGRWSSCTPGRATGIFVAAGVGHGVVLLHVQVMGAAITAQRNFPGGGLGGKGSGIPSGRYFGRQYLCVAVAWLVLAATSADAEQTDLRITLQFPIAGHLGVNLMRLKSGAERRAEGAIFDKFPAGQDNQALRRGVLGGRDGRHHLAAARSERPAIGIFEQLFLFNFEASSSMERVWHGLSLGHRTVIAESSGIFERVLRERMADIS